MRIKFKDEDHCISCITTNFISYDPETNGLWFTDEWTEKVYELRMSKYLAETIINKVYDYGKADISTYGITKLLNEEENNG